MWEGGECVPGNAWHGLFRFLLADGRVGKWKVSIKTTETTFGKWKSVAGMGARH